MAGDRRGYVVREAGASRPGKACKVYPCTLAALLDALDDARLRSCAGRAQEVVKIQGRARILIRRYDGGRDVTPPSDGGREAADNEGA